MTMSTPQNSSRHDAGPAADRLTNLELLFMHLERQVAELNQIVLKQGEQIERLQRDLQRLQRAAESPEEGGPESDEPSWGQ
jgi:uncharacterized coiled-coil protein SlyX